MFKMLGQMFGTAKTGDKIVGMIDRWTKGDETAKREYYLQWLETTKGSNIARRLLAIMVGLVWMIFTFITGFFIYFSETPLEKEALDFYARITYTFGVVMLFYFGKSITEKIKQK